MGRGVDGGLCTRGAAALLPGRGADRGSEVVEIYGGGLNFSKADSQKLAIVDLFDTIRAVTGGMIDPANPINVVKMVKEQVKAQLKERADDGRLMLVGPIVYSHHHNYAP